MQRNRLLAQIDDELVHVRASLKFWRDQVLLLAHTELQVTAKPRGGDKATARGTRGIDCPQCSNDQLQSMQAHHAIFLAMR